MHQDRFQGRLGAHLTAAALFVLLSLAWSFPLVLHVGTHVPGEGAGDNLGFVWNLWWMRTALHAHVNPFHTDYLFHPVGADLTQHTLTPLNGAVAATLLSPLSAVAAQNILILAALFLNGFVAYLLAFRLSARDAAADPAARWFGALLAGIAFGGAAPVLIRLYGHFNLVAAWVIPLAILLCVRAFERRSIAASAAAGFGVAVVIYSDYYYLLYTMVFLGVWLADRWWELGLTSRRLASNAVSKTLVVLIAVDLALMCAVALTGGFALQTRVVRVSMHSTFNMRVAFWLLCVAWGFSRWRLSLRARWRADADAKADLRTGCSVLAVFLLLAMPLVVGAVGLVGRGEYASQRYFWRSAPPGVDAGSLFLGNPLHLLYGSLTRRAYAALGFNPMESVAWLGSVALVLGIWGWRRLCSVAEARVWRAAAIIFGIWALGPWLNAFGRNLALPLPALLLRFVPFVSNARIPGRAMVLVSLAVAMLLSLAVAHAAAGWSRAHKAIVTALLLVDVATGAIPLYALEPGGVYASLRQQSVPGAVLELPLGIRDGFGESGQFDARTMYFQTISERPTVGGFVARMPQRVRSSYSQAPLLGTVLRLSDPACPEDWQPAAVSPGEVYGALSAASVRYVVLDRANATRRLLDYVSSWPLTLVMTADGRELYTLRKP